MPIAFPRTFDGRVQLFNVSGLLYNSSLVFYDRAPEGTDPAMHVPSLWSPVLRRAISGPFAAQGAQLAPLTGGCTTTWADWLQAHPDTTLPERDLGAIRRYKSISYARNFLSPRLDFPVTPIPSTEELATLKLGMKSPCVAVFLEEKWHALSIERMLPISTAGIERVASTISCFFHNECRRRCQCACVARCRRHLRWWCNYDAAFFTARSGRCRYHLVHGRTFINGG